MEFGTEDLLFGAYAPMLRRAGFAVLPAAREKPLMAGFAKWTTAPGWQPQSSGRTSTPPPI